MKVRLSLSLCHSPKVFHVQIWRCTQMQSRFALNWFACEKRRFMVYLSHSIWHIVQLFDEKYKSTIWIVCSIEFRLRNGWQMQRIQCVTMPKDKSSTSKNKNNRQKGKDSHDGEDEMRQQQSLRWNVCHSVFIARESGWQRERRESIVDAILFYDVVVFEYRKWF